VPNSMRLTGKIGQGGGLEEVFLLGGRISGGGGTRGRGQDVEGNGQNILDTKG